MTALLTDQIVNDANKGTAFRATQVCLDLHGFSEPVLPENETGQIFIRVAQSLMEEAALADWLRGW